MKFPTRVHCRLAQLEGTENDLREDLMLARKTIHAMTSPTSEGKDATDKRIFFLEKCNTNLRGCLERAESDIGEQDEAFDLVGRQCADLEAQRADLEAQVADLNAKLQGQAERMQGLTFSNDVYNQCVIELNGKVSDLEKDVCSERELREAAQRRADDMYATSRSLMKVWFFSEMRVCVCARACVFEM